MSLDDDRDEQIAEAIAALETEEEESEYGGDLSEIQDINLGQDYEEDREDAIAQYEADIDDEVVVESEFPELSESQKEDYALWVIRQHENTGEPLATNLVSDEAYIKDMQRISKASANYTFNTPMEKRTTKYTRNSVLGAKGTLSSIPEMTNQNEGYRGNEENLVYLNEFNGHKGHYSDKISYRNNPAHSKRFNEKELRPLRHDTKISEIDMSTRVFGARVKLNTSTQANENVNTVNLEDNKRSFFKAEI